MGSRFHVQAADTLRRAIRENDGHEVFAIGDVDGGVVVSLTITCRGQADRVVALVDRPRAGQVVVHNHPSGDLTPSDADMQLASRYGEGGVGVVIVDNEVGSSNWVVEPYVKVVKKVGPDRVRAFFLDRLPKAIDGFEPRPQQIEMALAVAAALDDDRPLAVEAGTGTGKSLAYLVPAALWALENDAKVVVSTFTRALQGQLVTADRPVLARAGLDVRVEVVQGRNNYLCKRRLALASEDDDEEEVASQLESLRGWSATSADGSRLDLPFPLDAGLWERVLSDSDLTLRSRCEHFASCHYYEAIRRASAAHVVIVNHALLMADLQVRADANQGILPKYDRLILDEAHHLEDAATGIASRRLTAEAVRRAVAPLLDRPRRRGALGRISKTHLGTGSKVPGSRRDRLEEAVLAAEGRAHGAARSAEDALGSLASLLGEDGAPVRVTPAVEASPDFRDWMVPTLKHLAQELEGLTEELDEVLGALEGVRLADAEMEPVLDLKRARRRLLAHVDLARSWVAPSPGRARWFEPTSRQDDGVAIAQAPIDMGPTLRETLWDKLGGVVCTSATMTVAGSFQHWAARVGLAEHRSAVFPSPFDHFRQALLGLPRDLPEPNTPSYLEKTAEAVVDAVALTDGGAFVLCTSYAAVRAYADALRRAGRPLVLAQGEGERTRMLERFLENRRSVLVGTDSFWEGVSVKGDGLRLVIIPRVPFRVPSDPLHEARQEAMQERGVDSFSAYSLPEAVLKLRQGYGRLIRSQTDRGVVLLLDARVHSRRYGRILLQSLPPARRVKGPMSWILAEMRTFFAESGPVA